jgi:hypothetical protein
MRARQVHYWNDRLSTIRPSYFLILALFFALLSVFGLRSNYSHMVELREAVYAADRENGDVEGALRELREHVYSHMNTNLSSGNNAIKPPIQLKYQYERLASTEAERARLANQQVTARGEAICGAQYPAGGFNAPRVACIQAYVSQNASSEVGVPESLYKFDFVSPRWSPDLAGLSMLASGVAGILFVARIAIGRYVRSQI